jgi:hypothetical protein
LFGGIKKLLAPSLRQFFQGNTLEVIHQEIDIMKVKRKKDGLSIVGRLMLLKYQMNGIHGFILQTIK